METAIFDSFIESLIKSRFTPHYHKKDNNNQLRFNLEIINKLLLTSEEVLKMDPFKLNLNGNFIVVGDLHGNIDDLLRIFTRCGYPPEQKYLFMGDYVDRGQNSLEVFLLLLALKVRHPNHLFLLRGNHESDSMTSVYGFRAEIRRRLNKQIFGNFLRVFRHLPICAVLNDRVFCVHGGISKDLHKLSQLDHMKKPAQIPQEGIIADMLWSDPSPTVDNFQMSDRGVGYLFGAYPLTKFLDNNNLELLVRSHESCDKGYNWPFDYSPKTKEKCLTIFSTSDYCDEENDAAVLRVPADGDYEILSFSRGKKIRYSLPRFLVHDAYEKTLNDSEEDEQIPQIPNARLLPLAA